MSVEVKLPELGEGISSGIVSTIVVSVGDSIANGDAIIEIETDKAVLPVPASFDGVIESIAVKEGEEIMIGAVIATMSEGAGATVADNQAAAPAEEAPAETVSEPEPVKESAPAATPVASGPVESQTVSLPELGEGIKGGIVSAVLVNECEEVEENASLIEIETDKAVLPVPAPFKGFIEKILVEAGQELKIGEGILVLKGASAEGSEAVVPTAQTESPKQESAPASQRAPAAAPVKTEAPAVTETVNTSKVVSAGPATRRFARELGLDLGLVTGSKRGGRIDIDDVKKHIKEMNLKGGPAAAAGPAVGGFAPQPLPDFSKFGPVKVEKASNLRKIISERMSRNWATIPHVYQFIDIDITDISTMAKKYAPEFKEKGSSASPTNFFIKAMAMALKAFPIFNTSFDAAKGEIVYKEFCNIGVAVDTPSGLIVPVLKGVDTMSVFDIGYNLKDLAKRTRERKVKPDELTGGCLTLTNLGGIGGTHFTPIINAPEVAIIGLGRASVKPIYIDGEFKPRTIAQMTLAYDHRVIDGADGARFAQFMKDTMENFEKVLLGGAL